MVSATKKIPVGAHYGWQDWLAQRVTAVIMLLFSIVIIGYFMLKGGVNYAEWKELFRSQTFRIFVLVFFLSVYYHAWIGIKDVLMDYIKPAGLRITAQVAVLLFLLGCSIWSVTIIWGV
ncbi:MAG: succinate dehydrogenase, hydrophobic membrane anchor protein [Burkholderiales bacterium]|nr:succinate dehydrogenase, hydrophobic membrane anchor protein [Burkholderiales bacterium]